MMMRLKDIVSAIMYAAEAPELEQVLERIADVSRDLVRSRYAALGIPNGRGGLRFFKTSGMTPEEIEMIDHLPEGHGLIGAIMRERRSIRLKHMRDDVRSAGFPDNHPHMDSLLGVPIQLGQQLFGMLYLTDRMDGLPFDEDDQALIETMAGYAALAIAGAELSQQQKRMKLLEERERIAMELHDGIIQSLYGIGMQVELLRLDAPVKGESLEPVVESLNDVIEDIRKYILNLRSRSDNQMTVRDCFNRICDRLHLPSRMTVLVDAPDEQPPFTPAVFDSICLIANEAVSNAVRHAKADKIKLSAFQENGIFYITVEDNGKGFNTLEMVSNQNGLGLRNMQQRARLYGGHVDIQSRPGQGTRLFIQIPIRTY